MIRWSGSIRLTARVGRKMSAGGRWLFLFLAAVGCGFLPGLARGETPATTAIPAAEKEFFEKRVRPLLLEKCATCHGATKQKGGLRLDSGEHVRTGGESGPVVVPGKPDDSLLIDAVRYTGDYKMPPSGKLPESEIAVLTEWVRQGARWPLLPQQPSSAGSPSGKRPGTDSFDLAGRKARQWALQPVRPVAPPAVQRGDWPRTAIDRFILHTLESHRLQPAPAADRRTWLRRVTFDLIGLPPRPDEIRNYLRDTDPQAESRVVERLLASPHYGERWARHWLDLVRYAETYGHEFDSDIPWVHKYRDYVIRAFNDDLPYSQFITEQIAGDLLGSPRRNSGTGANESILGTGFYFLGEAKHSPVDLAVDEGERVDNQLDVLGKAFLGMTISCARCHDHKFDAIGTRDYYALTGYLRSTRQQIVCIDDPAPRAAVVRDLVRLRQERGRLQQRLLRGSSPGSGSLAPHATASQHPGAALEQYLLAVARSLEAAPEPERGEHKGSLASVPESRITAAAAEFQVPVNRLRLWVSGVQREAARGPQALFAPWLAWAKVSRKPALKFSDFCRQRSAEDKMAAAEVASRSRRDEVFANFERGDYRGWFVTGEAFGSGPLSLPGLASAPGSPAALWPPGFAGRSGSLMGGGVVHSGAISAKLQGALRSPTFLVTRPWLHLHIAGRNARVRLVVDGLQLIRYPLYGYWDVSWKDASSTGSTGTGLPPLQWITRPTQKAIGHRAYLELLDEGDGEIALDQILFSDEKTAPSAPPLALTATFLPSPSSISREISPSAFARQYANLLTAAATGTTTTRFTPGQKSHAWQWLEEQRASGWNPLGEVEEAPALAAQLAVLERRLQEREADLQYREFALTAGDGTPFNDAVHLRGNYKFKGETVPRRFVEALGGTAQPAPETTSGRLELARQIAAPENPLTARVLVNRLWKHHFGEGLVSSPDDFGNMGQPPSHPELLDYLATEFVKRGWSIKQLHREIVLSATYHMSSRPGDPQAEAADPGNRWLHRMPVRRLEAEAIRDALLAVTGRLDGTLYGPSVPPHLTEFMEGRGRPQVIGPLDGAGRRTIYLAIRRNFLNPLLMSFDMPVPFAPQGRRSVTHVPAQALALLNNPFVQQQADRWGRQVASSPLLPAERIARMYEAAFGRAPTPEESAAALAYVHTPSGTANAEAARPWIDLAHVLFNVKEFVFIN